LLGEARREEREGGRKTYGETEEEDADCEGAED
jgi:hypothetical protein